MDGGEVRPRTVWHRVGALAAHQHGRVSGDQLLGCGLTRRQVAQAVEHARLFPVLRGVYAVGHPGWTQEAHWMAAVLACSGSVLSHGAASALLRLARQRLAPAEVSVPRPASARRRGIAVHHVSSLAPHDVTVRWRIPVTNEARTLVDLAAVTDRRGLEVAFDRAARRRVLDLAAVHEVLGRIDRPRGARVLRAVLAEHDSCPWTRSELERRFVRMCHGHGVTPPIVNLPLEAGGERLVADFVWPAARLVVETDGMEFHGSAPAARWDRRRDRLLVLAGWRVLRYTWVDIAERGPETAAEIEVALRPVSGGEVRPRRAG